MGKSFQLANSLVCAVLLHFCFSYGQQVTLRGTVHGVDGPLAGATIAVAQIKMLTNTHGNFIVVLNPGHYVLYITHVGYKKIAKEVRLDSGNTSVEFTMMPNEEMSEVTVLGSRSATQRSNLSTPVPVDVVSSRQLLQTSQTTLTQMLQFTVPSFNASRQLVNEPITLRGLDPDQVLILVNGKRHHNMSVVNFGGVRGILGRGAVSNDLNAIPFSAIEKIEVLRDGASAQFGSDAIAGVINVQLTNSSDKTWGQVHTGQFYDADGGTVSVGINQSCKFIKKGFISFSGNFRFQKPTYRGGEFNGTVYLPIPVSASHDDSIRIKSKDDSIINARNFDRHSVSNAGSSKHTAYDLSVNGGYPFSTRTEAYWTIVLSHRNTVFVSGYTFPKNTNRINPDLFPDGFKSRPNHHTYDIFTIAGVKGETKTNWRWDASNAYGNNRDRDYNNETNNASQYFTLGKNAPTSFYTGALNYAQLTNNLQFSKSLSRVARKASNLALGAEWRIETDQLIAGEEASWKTYDATGRKLGGSGGLVFSPQDEVKASRNVVAAYADVESEFADRFLIDVAARYEYYNDFGGNIAGKLAARYKFNPRFSVRGSLSNGFRAPSIQQRYYSQTRIAVSNTAGGYSLLTSGIFRNDSPVADALGIPSLHAERSLNLSGGFAGTMCHNIQLTIDAYWIQIRNRIVLSGVFDRTVNRDVDSLLHGLTDVSQVQFFVNAINTRTKGIDIMLNGNWRIRKSSLSLMFGANMTSIRLFGEIKAAGNLKADSVNTNTLFNVEERTKIEHGQPQGKVILGLTYDIGKIELIVRNTWFGKTAIAPAYSDPKTRNTSFIYESFSPRILTDITATYSIKKWISLTLGGNNIFDVYPSRLSDYRNTGEGAYIYSQDASPFAFNGGYYFVSTEIKF